jgi:hypothetical protein
MSSNTSKGRFLSDNECEAVGSVTSSRWATGLSISGWIRRQRRCGPSLSELIDNGRHHRINGNVARRLSDK